MSTKLVLQENRRLNPAKSLMLRTLFHKQEVLRYLPSLVYGFLSFGTTGYLEANSTPVLLGLTAPSTVVPTQIVTVGAGTYTAAIMAVGLVLRDPTGAGRTDTTDTATALVAALELTENYQEKHVIVVNQADAAETITLAGGTGVTLKGAITVPQNCATKLAVMRIDATHVCIREI